MANTSPKAERPANQDATSSAKPLVRFAYAGLSAAVFIDKVKMPSGKTVAMGHVSLRRSYRTAAGQWEHTHSLGQDDLLPAAHLLKCCFEHLRGLKAPEERPVE